MAPQAFVKVGSTWTEITGTNRPYVNVAGTWQGVTEVHAKVGAAWQQVYQYDSTAPVVRTFTVTGQSNANVRVSWSGGALVTDAGSGVASVKIQRQYTPFGGSGEGWTDVQTLTQAEWEATSSNLDFTPSGTKRRQQAASWPYADTTGRYYMGFRVVAVDNVALSTTTAEVKAFTKPSGAMHALTTAQNSAVVSGSWTNPTPHAVRCGDATSVGGSNWDYGCYFYGATALSDLCSGYTPDSGNIYIQRSGASGTSGTWYLQPHNLASASGTPTFSGTLYGAAISGTDDFENCAFPSDWLTGVAGGTMLGIGMVKNGSTAYHVLRDYLEGLSDSSHISLTFT